MQRREPNPTDERPDNRSEASESMLPAIIVMRDTYAGTERLLSRPERYLPRGAAERIDDYRGRLAHSVFFNGVRRSVSGLAGMVFRTDPILGEDVPKEIIEHAENIDLQGSHLDIFARQIFEDALVAGHSFILVDAPIAPDGLSLGAEKAGNIRPFWVRVQAEDVLSWRSERVGARTVLSQVVIREISDEDVGSFGSMEVERFRIYRRVVGPKGVPIIEWELLAIDGSTVFGIDSGIIKNIHEIPLVPVYGDRSGFFMSTPPLIDLAMTNLTHYRVLSDLLWSLHMASIPVPVLSGVAADQEIEIGPNRAMVLPDAASSFAYAEPSGAAHGAARQMVIDLQTHLAVLGLGMLQRETRAAQTAESKKLDRSEQDSSLAVAARSLQDALETCLDLHARMIGLPSGGSIVVSREFQNVPITDSQVDALSKMVLAEQLSLPTLLSILQSADLLPDDFDVEVELERIGEGLFPRLQTEGS